MRFHSEGCEMPTEPCTSGREGRFISLALVAGDAIELTIVYMRGQVRTLERLWRKGMPLRYESAWWLMGFAEGEIDSVGSRKRMRAVLESQHAVIAKSRGAAP